MAARAKASRRISGAIFAAPACFQKFRTPRAGAETSSRKNAAAFAARRRLRNSADGFRGALKLFEISADGFRGEPKLFEIRRTGFAARRSSSNFGRRVSGRAKAV
jgi:hypothetical protein